MCDAQPQLAFLAVLSVRRAACRHRRATPRHRHVQEGQVREAEAACYAGIHLLRLDVPGRVAEQLSELKGNKGQDRRVDVLVGPERCCHHLLKLGAGEWLRSGRWSLEKSIALEQRGPFLDALNMKSVSNMSKRNSKLHFRL